MKRNRTQERYPLHQLAVHHDPLATRISHSFAFRTLASFLEFPVLDGGSSKLEVCCLVLGFWCFSGAWRLVFGASSCSASLRLCGSFLIFHLHSVCSWEVCWCLVV